MAINFNYLILVYSREGKEKSASNPMCLPRFTPAWHPRRRRRMDERIHEQPAAAPYMASKSSIGIGRPSR